MSGKCKGCEFCFPEDDTARMSKKSGKFICGDVHYGEDITKSLDEEKECYSQGFDDFMKEQAEHKTVFSNGEVLSDLKIDGRKTYAVFDVNDEMLYIRGSILKKMFNSCLVFSRLDDEIKLITTFGSILADKNISNKNLH